MPRSRPLVFQPIVALCGALLLVAPVSGDDAPPTDGPTTLGAAITGGEFHLGLRYRYEFVDDAPRDQDAHASTLRTTLSYRSLAYHGFSVRLEAEDVSAIGNDLYRNLGAGGLDNGVRDRPVVADPEITDLVQAVLRFEKGATAVELGRREINLDNQRFVGAVGWRQHHQSFDTAIIEQRSLPKTTLRYAYLDAVHRIFGDRLPMSSHLLNAAIALGKDQQLVLYGYLLDYDDRGLASLSTRTLGARWTGTHNLSRGRLSWQLEAAQQDDHADNPTSIDAGYRLAEIGYGRGGLSGRLGIEVLEGEPGQGRFSTPLATLHKWNGWADKFLATPSPGLVDSWAALRFERGKWSADAVYHVFESDTGSIDYGTELDLQVSWKSPWRQVFAAKAALYDADRFSFDTDKLMVWTAWGF